MQRDVAERPPPLPSDPPAPATEDGSPERPRPSVRSLLLEGVAVSLAGFGGVGVLPGGVADRPLGAVLAVVGFGFGSVSLQHIILLNQLQVIAWMPLVLALGAWRWSGAGSAMWC